MSNYNSLKATINANVKTNGNQEITGSVLNSVLNAMVNTLGAGYQYAGVATPSTNPGTPDARVFYLATSAGTYTYFDELSLADGEVSILKYDTSWSKDVTGCATQTQIRQLELEIGGIVGFPEISVPTVSNRQYPARRDGSMSADGSVHGYIVDLTPYSQYKEVTFSGICKAGSNANKVVAGIFVDENGVVLKEVTGVVAMRTFTESIPDGAVRLWASYLLSGGMPASVTFSAVPGTLDAKANQSEVDILAAEIATKAEKSAAYVGIPVTSVMSRFYLNRVAPTSGFYIVGKSPLEIGKTYQIVFNAIRNYQYNLHLVIVNTSTPSTSADIVQYLASFNQSNSPFNGIFEYVPDASGQYVCVWTQSGGSFEIIELSVNDLTSVGKEISDTLVGFRNFDLFLASKKRYLTSAQQSAIGLSPDAKYNNISSLFQFVHVSDLHQDMNRFARAVNFCKQNGILLVNTGDTAKQSGTEGISSFVALLDDYDGKYIHCIGNHDSWGYTEESSVYNKYISPFITKFGWQMPSGISSPTYFLYDDATAKLRFVVLNQWEKYNVATGSTHLSQQQADFLVNSLMSVPSGYAVIVIEHTPNDVLVKDVNYPKFFQSPFSGSIGEASTKMISDIVDAWISGTTLQGTYNINGSITINADFSSVASHEFIAFVNGHTHEDAITYMPNATNLMVVLNITTSNCYIAPSGEGTLAESSDLYRDDKSELQDAFNVYTIDRDAKTIKVVRIGSDIPFNLGEKRDCMVVPYM